MEDTTKRCSGVFCMHADKVGKGVHSRFRLKVVAESEKEAQG